MSKVALFIKDVVLSTKDTEELFYNYTIRLKVFLKRQSSENELTIAYLLLTICKIKEIAISSLRQPIYC